MKRKIAVFLLTLCVLISLGFVSLPSQAASSALASVDWWAVSNGGGISSVADIVIQDTLGQPIIGNASGETIQLQSGFWVNTQTEVKIHLPMILR